MGQVEPRLGETITRANVWLVQAPGHIEQCVGCHSAGSNSRYGNGTALYGSVAEEGGRPGRAYRSLEAGVELAERGARRAVMDFWGRLHGFAQLGVPKRGWDSVGRYDPIVRVTEMRGVLVWESPELLGWPGLAGGFPLVCTADPLMGPL